MPWHTAHTSMQQGRGRGAGSNVACRLADCVHCAYERIACAGADSGEGTQVHSLHSDGRRHFKVPPAGIVLRTHVQTSASAAGSADYGLSCTPTSVLPRSALQTANTRMQRVRTSPPCTRACICAAACNTACAPSTAPYLCHDATLCPANLDALVGCALIIGLAKLVLLSQEGAGMCSVRWRQCLVL